MTDIVSPTVRSRMMSGIRSKNTSPELQIRRGLFNKGFRYLLHDRRLPGTPDLVFPRYHVAIVINGCFWHGHECHLFKWPKSNTIFWKNKIIGNKTSDRRHYRLLRSQGWRVLTLWECAIKGSRSIKFDQVISQIARWIKAGHNNMGSSPK